MRCFSLLKSIALITVPIFFSGNCSFITLMYLYTVFGVKSARQTYTHRSATRQMMVVSVTIAMGAVSSITRSYSSFNWLIALTKVGRETSLVGLGGTFPRGRMSRCGLMPDGIISRHKSFSSGVPPMLRAIAVQLPTRNSLRVPKSSSCNSMRFKKRLDA